MEGRLEHQIKTEKSVEKFVLDKPDYVKGYYNGLSSKGSYTSRRFYVHIVCKYINYLKSQGYDINDMSVFNVDNTNLFFSSIKYNNKGGVVKEISNSYKKVVWSCLNDFYKYLVGTSRIDKNPCDYIQRAKGTDNVKRVCMAPSDINTIIKKIDNDINKTEESRKWSKYRNKAIIYILITTGVRITALTEINVNDVMFAHDESGKIAGATIRITDKEHRYYERYVPKEAAVAIKEWITERAKVISYKEKDALFISSYRMRISATMVRNIVESYSPVIDGKQITPHKFRATYGTMLYKETKDIYYVQKQMGHKNPSTTEIYVVDDGSDERKASEIIERVMNKGKHNKNKDSD